jgi:starch synthase
MTPDGLEYWGKFSLLKSGIVYSDLITTVSPKYAQELLTPEYGMGMEGVLVKRREDLKGILNGIDYDQWDPGKDTHLSARYTPADMSGKMACKESLLREMGLDESLKDKPLLAFISRLDRQKGLDLLLEVLDNLLDKEVGLVILGSGDEGIQSALQEKAEDFSGRISLALGFNEPLAHRIMAGADILLIPSRYEPCGLTQMYALKYGTVPVVRATGGLDDTIRSFDRETTGGNGFKFEEYDAGSFLTAIKGALDLYQDEETWEKLMANGMAEDFSWERSAHAYIEIYKSMTEGQR